MNRNGRNPRTVVITPTVIGPTTALAPEIAASSERLPRSRSAAMLSPTTTASSTTMPTIRKNPKIVPMLRVRSAGAKKSSEPMKESGIPTVTHVAIRRSNSSTRLRKTSSAPIKPFLMISDRRSSEGCARSFQMLTVTFRGRVVAREPALDLAGHSDHRLRLGGVDSHQHRRPAVESGDDGLVDEPVADLRHVAERHDGTVEPGDERDVPELLAEASLGDGLENHSAGIGAQLPERQVQRSPLHGVGDLVERQVVAAQLLLAQLDRYLAVAGALAASPGRSRAAPAARRARSPPRAGARAPRPPPRKPPASRLRAPAAGVPLRAGPPSPAESSRSRRPRSGHHPGRSSRRRTPTARCRSGRGSRRRSRPPAPPRQGR